MMDVLVSQQAPQSLCKYATISELLQFFIRITFPGAAFRFFSTLKAAYKCDSPSLLMNCDKAYTTKLMLGLVNVR